MRPVLRSFPDKGAWMEAALGCLRAGLELGSAAGEARLCLAGGGTPRPVYEAFAAGTDPELPVLLVPGDERLVPRGSPGRNGDMIQAAFDPAIRGSAAWRPPPRLLFWPEGGAEDEARVLAEYAALLQSLGRPARPLFDLVLLGLGTDGHCAGIFPGRDYDWSPDGPPTVPGRAPRPPFARASLGPSALTSTGRLVFLASGREKRPVVEALSRGEGADWPSARLIELYARRATEAPGRDGPEPVLLLYCEED